MLSFPRPHDPHLQPSRHRKHRLLGPAGSGKIQEYAHLHRCPPEPRRRHEELEGVWRRPRVAEGQHGIERQGANHFQGRVRLHGSHRLLETQMTMDPARLAHMRLLVEQLHKLQDRLREGGGTARIERQHKAGKLTARERIAALVDPGAHFLEIGLLVAYDRYDGQAPAAGVVTGLGKIEGRPAVIVANDATVKAGAWWPETITKILRAQEIAMRNRTPIVYLVDSAGVNLPYQDGIFPGQYGAGRIFLYNSLMRRRLRVPKFAAVMGPCIAGGAYLPALSDILIMVEKTSFMGLGGPNLVKGATGQVIDSESLGGAKMHTESSGVAHYMAKDDAACLEIIREHFRRLPEPISPSTGK